jgi:drug/metabolite transporter (DMT)-like permease
VRPAPSGLAGIALVLAAVACFSLLDTTAKYVSAGVPLLMALWFRYFFQAAATTAVVLPLRGMSVLRTAHPKFHCLRGLLLLLSSLFAFLSLKYMPVAEFTAVVAITPLVLTLLAATALAEKVSALRWSLVVGGFVGTLIILRPGGEDFDWTMLLPLCVVVTNTGFQVLTSKLAKTEDPMTMHLYTGWIGALLASAALPFVWTSLPSWSLWGWLIVMGAAATVGHFMLILAYMRTPAATLTPYLYAQIGFAMLGGWVAFAHVPDRWSLVGVLLIAFCGAIGAWLTARESRALNQFMVRPAES